MRSSLRSGYGVRTRARSVRRRLRVRVDRAEFGGVAVDAWRDVCSGAALRRAQDRCVGATRRPWRRRPVVCDGDVASTSSPGFTIRAARSRCGAPAVRARSDDDARLETPRRRLARRLPSKVRRNRDRGTVGEWRGDNRFARNPTLVGIDGAQIEGQRFLRRSRTGRPSTVARRAPERAIGQLERRGDVLGGRRTGVERESVSVSLPPGARRGRLDAK